ncbi:MAG: hypothetical protein WA057_01600 [Candidatus Magasanikiibacteriota bacterium]
MISEKNKLEAIDVKEECVSSKGIAYYRLDDGLFNFLKLCNQDEKIIGFEWDGSRNFGVILGKE